MTLLQNITVPEGLLWLWLCPQTWTTEYLYCLIYVTFLPISLTAHLFLKPVVVSGHAWFRHVIIHWSWLLMSGGPKLNFIRREKEALKWSCICPYVSWAWVVLHGYGKICHIPSNAAWQKGANEEGLGSSTALSSCKLVQKSSRGERSPWSRLCNLTSFIWFHQDCDRFVKKATHRFESQKTGTGRHFGKRFFTPNRIKASGLHFKGKMSIADPPYILVPSWDSNVTALQTQEACSVWAAISGNVSGLSYFFPKKGHQETRNFFLWWLFGVFLCWVITYRCKQLTGGTAVYLDNIHYSIQNIFPYIILPKPLHRITQLSLQQPSSIAKYL